MWHVHLKMDKVDFKKATVKFFFCIFLQSPHQVDMKKVVKCPREYFAYFNGLETRGVIDHWYFDYLQCYVRY